MYFSTWDSKTSPPPPYNIVILGVYVFYWKRNTQLRKIFLWIETVLRVHRMKSDEKPFSVNFMHFLKGF